MMGSFRIQLEQYEKRHATMVTKDLWGRQQTNVMKVARILYF